MSKTFYRDVQLIIFCKVCKVPYRPQRYSFFALLGLCHKHRGEYYKQWYLNRYLPFFAQLSPEQKQKYRDRRYQVWKKWVAANVTRRRAQALKSYHLNKDKHRARKHRSTV